MWDDLGAVGLKLRSQVLQWTGLPTSVGFGPTKTLAKLANHVAKSADRRRGSYPEALAKVCHLGEMPQRDREDVMRATAVGDVWGIGRKTSARLNESGIRTVLDLVRADLASLRRQFSVVLEKTVLELRGTSCLDVDDAPAPNQQIMCSRSFGEPVTALPALVEVVSQFASRVAEKLRGQGSAAGAVHVFITTSPFRARDRQHSPSATVPLGRPTADTLALVAATVQALERMYRPGFNYAKAGVMLADLRPEGTVQGELDMFARTTRAQSTGSQGDAGRLMSALDAVNQRFGKGALTVASAVRKQRTHPGYVSRQERRSPRYTTRLDEVVSVRA